MTKDPALGYVLCYMAGFLTCWCIVAFLTLRRWKAIDAGKQKQL